MLGGRPYIAPRQAAPRSLCLPIPANGRRLDAGGRVDESETGFASRPDLAIHYEGLLSEPDQWTLQHARSLPMHRVALGDQEDTRLYFQSGLAKSSSRPPRRASRGVRRRRPPLAVLHPVSQERPALDDDDHLAVGAGHADVRAWTGVGLLQLLADAVPGLASLASLHWSRVRRRQPRVDLSGLLSVDPWDWQAETSPTSSQQEAFTGGALPLADLTLSDIKARKWCPAPEGRRDHPVSRPAPHPGRWPGGRANRSARARVGGRRCDAGRHRRRRGMADSTPTTRITTAAAMWMEATVAGFTGSLRGRRGAPGYTSTRIADPIVRKEERSAA